MRRLSFAAGLGLLMLSASLAHATEGFVVGRTDLLSGPAQQFPNVRILPAGASVEVHGCLKNMQWCDVTWRGKRGWVNSMSVAYAGPHTDVAVTSFTCDQYWDAHYKSQNFYVDKDKWRGLADEPTLTKTTDVSSAN
jgi:uncharacterized protein YraI